MKSLFPLFIVVKKDRKPKNSQEKKELLSKIIRVSIKKYVFVLLYNKTNLFGKEDSFNVGA
jgi:hypothetical protein